MCATSSLMVNYCISFIRFSWHVTLTSHHISKFWLIVPIWMRSQLWSLSVTRSCLSSLYQPNNESRHISAWHTLLGMDKQQHRNARWSIKKTKKRGRGIWKTCMSRAPQSCDSREHAWNAGCSCSDGHKHIVFPNPQCFSHPRRNDRRAWSS